LTAEPETFQDASVTNGFFMSNVMHDFSYVYGFDEAAGNFQQNNYNNGGNGNDYVNMHIDDGSGINNANMATPPDGSNPTMQMFLWNSTAASGLLTVNEPATVAGIYEVSHPGDWGGQIDMTPLTAEVAIVDDGSPGTDWSRGCNDLINGADVSGKIAIIDRGLCQFGLKALNAQNAGAVGVIICNFEDAPVGMAGGDFGGQVTIPVISIGSGLCTDIRIFAGSTLNLTFVEQPMSTGPEFVSGGLDNGVIAHEYAHGISNRLIGGGNNTGCLGNGEQMGEGISDIFSLVTTVKPGDNGEMKRGIGTFVQREEVDGDGIRRFPYSTDMTINPLTYNDIVGQGVHATGEIWTLCLWEMYWLLVEEYGFDEDLYEGAAGNNIALNLIIEGMKLTACSPGFVDARNGVLAADQTLYNGANQCLIWEAFAKRGVGLNADQGSAFDNSDGVENFERPIECLDEIQIDKTVNELINPGEDIDVVINVRNYKQIVSTNVTVTDDIPTGATVLPSSIVGPGTVSGNMITFAIGEMQPEEEMQLSYTLETDPSIKSIATFNDDQEGDPDEKWDIAFLNGTSIFDIRDDSLAHSGEKAWFVQDVGVENDQTLFIKDPIAVTGVQPVLRFYHWYDSEAGADGGLIEVSTDGGTIWEQVGENMFRHEYPRGLQYGTLVIPFLSAFSGQSSPDSEDFVATYVDMSDYLGEDIFFRFRFASDDNTSGIGWFIDDVTFMDMKNYQGVACVTTDEGDNECTDVEERGTVVEPENIVSSKDLFKTNMEVNVFPNPAQDILNIQVLNDKFADASLRIFTVDGKEMMNRSLRTVDGLQTTQVNVAGLSAGMYFVKVSTDEGIVVEKVTIK